jgi:hypothetical protein
MPTGHRLDAIETLEGRQLMTTAPLAVGESLTINFEPADAATPDWMLADHGEVFAPRGKGPTFGWSRDLPVQYLIERNSPLADWQGRDTLATFAGTDAWEIAVANGTYRVYLVAGDPSHDTGTYSLQLEDAVALTGAVTDARRFLTSTTDVVVRDGKLTLTAGPGASVNTICFLTIEALSLSSTPAGKEPVAPGGLTASDITRSSAKLTWSGDAENAESLQVERTADHGANWETVATLHKSVTGWTDTTLSSGSTYFYRIRAVSGDVISKPTPVVRVITLAPLPASEGTFDGIAVSYHEDPDKVIPVLKQLGMKSIRMWSDLEWDQRTFRLEWQQAIQYHNAGFHVTLLLQEDKVPTPQQARDYFTFALNAPGMREAVDRWEIVNEANLKQYWKGTLEQYVNNVLKPAHEVFGAANEPIVGTGIAYDTAAVKRLVDLGYLDYVDYANFHPYGYGAADHVRVLTEAVELLSSKPIVLTEWNLNGNPRDERGWAAMLDSVRDTLTATVENAYYFSFSQFYGSAPQQVWPASIFLKVGDDYVPNPIFYDLMQGWIDETT